MSTSSIGTYPSSASHSTATASAAVEPPSLACQALDGIYQVGMTAAAGALAGYAFSFINPTGGAIFAVTSYLSRTIATNLTDQFVTESTATAIKAALWATSFIASIGIGIMVTTAVGFPLTTLGAVGMTVGMFVTTVVVNILKEMAIGCYGCCQPPQSSS